MSDSTLISSHIFNTDIGNVLVNVEEVAGYDVEDVIGDRAFSQAQILRMETIAENIDVNAPRGARTLKTAYLEN